MLEALRLTLEEMTSGLTGVAQKRLFGCDGFFAEDQIFALVWKTGRIGLKLVDTEAFCELMKTKGSAPWQAGDRTMAHWVLVPESYHQNAKALQPWVAKAHAMALSRPKIKAKAKNAAPKKTVKRTAPECAPKRQVGRAKTKAK